MIKTLNVQYHGIFCIMWLHIKVFTKCFRVKSVCPVIWWGTKKEKSTRFQETVILCEAFRENFKKKVGSSLCYHMISVHTGFCVSICLIFRFAYLVYYCFCAIRFSVSHLSIVFKWDTDCVICLLSTWSLQCYVCTAFIVFYFQYLTCGFFGWIIFSDFRILIWMLFRKHHSKLRVLNSCLLG